MEDDRQSAAVVVRAGGFLALVGGWTLPFASAALWSAFILTTIASTGPSPLSHRDRAATARAFEADPSARGRRDLKLALSQIALLVTFLAHQAWVMSDAILRTLFRLIVSRRNLLEWVTAAQAKVSPRLDLLGSTGRWPAVSLSPSGRGRDRVGRAGLLAGRGAVRRSLAAVARRRAMDQPAAGVKFHSSSRPRTRNRCA